MCERKNLKGIRNKKEQMSARKLPAAESLTASYALPSRRRRCAGKTQRAVSPSGAPTKAAGMKEGKVCVIDAAISRDARSMGICVAGKKAESE